MYNQRYDQRNKLIAELAVAIGDQYVLHRPEEVMLYEYDGSALDQALPEIVVVPGSTAEVAAVTRIAAAARLPLVARGAGTGLSGGSIPVSGGIVVSLARLDRILRIDPVDRTAIVQPGVINVELSERAAVHGLHFAPDPSSQRSSTIGGNVAVNAGGPHCLKYGVTSNHVLAATVVLSDGSIVHLGGTAPNAPGYDLLGAFIGSEGTLGIATELTVRLTPNSEDVRTFLVIYDELDATSTSVSAIIAAGIVPAALEMMVGRGIAAVEAAVQAGYPADARAVLLIEIDGLREELEVQAKRIIAVCEQHGARIGGIASLNRCFDSSNTTAYHHLERRRYNASGDNGRNA
ncbi:MAG: FAD-binding protein, partial [Chloroflexales bacterium]|nr:FAD-binding protein [Chloroflexales bacterium]